MMHGQKNIKLCLVLSVLLSAEGLVAILGADRDFCIFVSFVANWTSCLGSTWIFPRR